MRIGIIGYGKMGKAVEQIAQSRNHNIASIIDIDSSNKINKELANIIDVAIEFTSPTAAKDNIYKCLENGIPVVSGSTGITFDSKQLSDLCKTHKTSMLLASNFSIGVNILMEINEKLSSLMSNFDSYEASMEETHHIHKLDEPSGTAISLADGIMKNNSKYVKWELNSISDIRNIGITSLREGETIGDHKITWESEIDSITIEHSAKNRKGFALGAVLAAEYIKNRVGLFTMRDLLKI